MNKKMSKRERDIKSKLMAAIAMLLVSSIMMVSTTYAWFTLSTAPEVTGITTSVGANGNLEMALLPADANLSTLNTDITSGQGDSMSTQDVELANVTWGNLVDLSKNEVYGLDKISLYPSALDAAADEVGNPTKLGNVAGPLKTPQYGADGRVTTVQNNTVLSRYHATDGFSTGASGAGYGVRAVGAASGMTTRQLDYRNALAAGSSAMDSAIGYAQGSLKANGGQLAGIALAKVAGDAHTLADIDALLAMIDGLVGSDPIKADGALDFIEQGYNQYFLAMGASLSAQNIEKTWTPTTSEPDANEPAGQAEGDDTTTESSSETTTGETTGTAAPEVIYLAIKSIVSDSTKSQAEILDELMTTLVDEYGMDLTEAIKQNIANVDTIRNTAETAKTDLTTLRAEVAAKDEGEQTCTWGELSPILTSLVNIDNMTINDIPVSEATDRISEIASNMANGLVLSMPTGGGIYADVADYCGNYTVGIKVYGEIKGIDLNGMDATMATSSSVNPSYLKVMRSAAEATGAPSKEGSTETQSLSEMYGYVIDLAFRTNAASSNLLLQTEAAGRIYDNDESSEETMGHGSTMTFTGSSGFNAEKVANLMKHIRIVFFDPAGGDVYGTAKLNMGTEEAPLYEVADDDLTVTADINMYTIGTGEVQVTYVEKTDSVEGTAEYVICYDNGTNGGFRKAGVGTHVLAADGVSYEPAGEGVTATHALGTSEGSYVAVADDEATHVRQETVVGAGQETFLYNSVTGNVMDAVITNLDQNTPKAVSVLVYLDGETITNADVAAGVSSATGTMNLQFASSANLVPMNYEALMGEGVATDDEDEITVTKAEDSDENVTLTDIAYDEDAKELTFKLGNTDENTTYKVTYNTTELSATDGVYTIENVEASVQVKVEVVV